MSEADRDPQFLLWQSQVGGADKLVAIMQHRVTWNAPLISFFTMHGLVRLALKHPAVSRNMREEATKMLYAFEMVFEANGLPAPEGGWRADVKLPDPPGGSGGNGQRSPGSG